MENNAIEDVTLLKKIKAQKSKEAELKTYDEDYMYQKDRELVSGIFKDYECKGGRLEFVYRKYKQEQVQTYRLEDGKAYKLPLGVAKHLNNNCYYTTHEYLMDANGVPQQRANIKNKRFGFQSLEFIEFEDFDRGGQPIINVENMAIAL